MLVLVLLTQVPATAAPPNRTIIVWNQHARQSDSLDQLAYETVLRSMGLHPERVLADDFLGTRIDSSTLLVVPQTAALQFESPEVDRILYTLRRGLTLITENSSPLSEVLGVKLGNPIRSIFVLDRLRPDLRLFWSDTPSVPWISGTGNRPASVVYQDSVTGYSLGVILQVGRGRCLYLSPRFDSRSAHGYGRFPTLPTVIVEGLGCKPRLTRRAAEAYFDAGYRVGISPDSLAAAWRRWGIRIVHAAAWYTYSRPAYDYRALITACHRNGILVYAWLEWPYIGRGFWDAHPEWRQKNGLLQDAQFDFLYLMDIRNPACMKRAISDLDSLLTLDWDGVNVAEFTITGAGKEGLEGPKRPDWFVGFTDYCRTEFKRESGFDPIELFDSSSPHYWQRDTAGLSAFFQYRIRVNIATQHELFEELHRIRMKGRRQWELMVTIVDNSLHPEFGNLLGFDMPQTVDLVKEFDLTLQVEDPYMEWMQTPERYRSVAENYRRILGDRPFLIDVNVVEMKPDRWKDFSAWKPVGTEVLQFWQHAAASGDRLCFYCEWSVDAADWALMPFAMAADAQARQDSAGWHVTSPRTVALQTGQSGMGFSLDGTAWHAYDDSTVIIPAGSHTVRQTANGPKQQTLRLVAISGELLDTRNTAKGLSIEYVSRPRCALSFNRKIGHVRLDGAPLNLRPIQRGTTSTIIAPPGRHTITVSPS